MELPKISSQQRTYSLAISSNQVIGISDVSEVCEDEDAHHKLRTICWKAIFCMDVLHEKAKNPNYNSKHMRMTHHIEASG
jgi:hypothetical protein